MLLSILGSAGIGLVYGWLGGNLFHRENTTHRATLIFALVTLAFSAAVRWMSGWREMIFFLAVALFSFLLHGAWRQELRRQFESSNSK